MLAKITRSCSVRLNGEVRELKAGEVLTLPPEKLRKMIGYAKQVQPDIEAYRALIAELREKDPKDGCWDWIVEHKSEMWGEFLQSLTAGDMNRARQIFTDMIAAWEAHNGQ